MKKAVIFTAMLVGALAFGFSQTAYTVRNAAGWVEAVNEIRNGGNDQEYTINVTGTISVPASTESTFGSVTGIMVTIEGSGTLSPSSNGGLLVIGKDQTVVVKDLTLKGRDNNNKAIVIIQNEGTFYMEGKASVTGNTNSSFGGVYNSGTFTMKGNASVSGNIYTSTSTSYSYGGGGVHNNGIFTMQDSTSVSGNTSSNSYSTFSSGGGNSNSGGGVYNSGSFTMKDNASVSGNTSSISSSRSSDYGSTRSYCGGGVYMNGGTFTMQDSASVSNNTVSSSYSYSPSSSYCGGGVYMNGGTFTMQDSAKVTDNKSSASSSHRSDRLDDNKSYGSGGVYVGEQGIFTMLGSTSVSGNTSFSSYYYPYSSSFSYSYFSLSGGVYVDKQGTFTMRGSTSVSSNASFSSSTSTSLSGGVYNSKTFIMQDNARVSGNTGRGVYNDGGFTMQDNASVTGNNGNGVYNSGTFTIKGSASVTGNTGSGVYVREGTFTMQDSVSISDNKTSGNGGGVYVDAKGTFTKTGGTIYGNDAEQGLKNTAASRKGHAIYEDKNKSWRNATAGLTMNPDSYGFWLNEEEEASGFQPGFIGIWKRSNFNNTLTITETTVKSSSRDFAWNFINESGDSYTLEANTAAKTKMTLTFKLVNGNLVISGDSGNGENNWNGTWYKQR